LQYYGLFPRNVWGGNQPGLNIDGTWENGQADWLDGYHEIQAFIQEATGKGVHVAALVLPMSPAFRNTPYYSRHGGLRVPVLEFLDSVQSLANTNSNFRLLDFNHAGNHDFTDAEAQDQDHLCLPGAIRVSNIGHSPSPTEHVIPRAAIPRRCRCSKFTYPQFLCWLWLGFLEGFLMIDLYYQQKNPDRVAGIFDIQHR